MKKLMFLAVVFVAGVSFAAESDRPRGFTFGESQRLTLKPYVALSYTWDSNRDSVKHAKRSSTWVVNPGFSLDYKNDNLQISGSAYYQYHAYSAHYTSQLNESSYGETFRVNWANSLPNEKGWKLSISEIFQRISQDDDMTEHGGRGIGRDRQSLNVSGVLERRLTERLHANLNGQYYYLDYDNNINKYGALYGWDRWGVGADAGYMFSRYLDVFIGADYTSYRQDNHRDLLRAIDFEDETSKGRRYKNGSEGWSLMIGVATRATEKLTYHARAGWSHFEYAGVYQSNGFVYQLDASWRIDEEGRWRTFLRGSSHYQPSEREYGSARKVYSLGWGLTHSMLMNRLDASLDLNFRKEDSVYADYRSADYNEYIVTARVGLTYHLRHYLSIYGRAEVQAMDINDGGSWQEYYDYNRFRVTVGVRLTY